MFHCMITINMGYAISMHQFNLGIGYKCYVKYMRFLNAIKQKKLLHSFEDFLEWRFRLWTFDNNSRYFTFRSLVSVMPSKSGRGNFYIPIVRLNSRYRSRDANKHECMSHGNRVGQQRCVVLSRWTFAIVGLCNWCDVLREIICTHVASHIW